MKNTRILNLVKYLLLGVFPVINCFSISTEEKYDQNKLSVNSDEIVFYSNGSIFSPVIVLQEEAVVTWSWEDNTTSNSLTPTKNYGTAKLRRNSLKVTPWSAVRRINIGYDALDGGSSSIELVADQKVSLVENLNLVAPYLKEWCSSYSRLVSLDFSNFTNIETIECFNSLSLKYLQLANTPKLKRVCFEDNDLINFDLRDCNSLEDIRGALNNFSTITFPTQTENIWHICVWSNPITNQNLFNNLSQFPMIAELWIPKTNQQGELVISKSHPTRSVSIWGWNNKYSSLDLRGAYKNSKAHGLININNNQLTTVDIAGCIQIKELNLSYNKLESFAIDKILKQVDEYGTSNGKIDLRSNQPPTYTGLVYKSNLENRGWIVNTDPNIPIETISVSSATGTLITTDNGTLQLSASILPTDATTKTVSWSVVNVTGKASISASGLLSAEKDGTVKAIATATDGSGVKGELTITISNQVVPVESISVSSASGTLITTDNGTAQLSASILPADATTKTVSWSVVNVTGNASISASGLLSAEKDGTVKAIATANDGSGVKGELTITISNQVIPVESISVSSASGTSITYDNGTLQLSASILPSDATTKSVIWSVMNVTGNASISASGLLTAEKDGTVKAIATANDGSGVKGELTITISNQVIPVESISVNSIGESIINSDNGTLQVVATAFPDDTTNKSVIWSVMNVTGKASISASGLLTAEKDGTVKAIATAADGSNVKGELTINISNQIIPVESISVSSASGTSITTDNGTLQLSASILPADATTKTVSWSVVNVTGKASISASGLLTAEKDGTIKAIATATDGSGVKGELTITISNQVVSVESISVSSASGTSITADNGTLQLSASILPADATTKTVSWSVVNVTGKASISASGLLSAEKDGTVKAIATATDGSGVKGELIITISNQVIPVETITILDNLKNDTINGIATKLSLKAVVTPQNATNSNVNWIVESITGQAKIDQNGELTTISEGSIKVIVKALDDSKYTTHKEYIIAIPVLLEQHNSLDNVKLFPNPASGTIQIHFDKMPLHGVTLEVRNPLGQLLLNKIIFENRSELSLKQYNYSLFFVTIIDKNSVSTHKIVNGSFQK
ncbi:MAG: Ig-like domain-containing protein [Bacteroidota bacterium]|nr:Ig-like domain-containing protein [Bacteroidota bacterium]